MVVVLIPDHDDVTNRFFGYVLSFHPTVKEDGIEVPILLPITIEEVDVAVTVFPIATLKSLSAIALLPNAIDEFPYAFESIPPAKDPEPADTVRTP